MNTYQQKQNSYEKTYPSPGIFHCIATTNVQKNFIFFISILMADGFASHKDVRGNGYSGYYKCLEKLKIETIMQHLCGISEYGDSGMAEKVIRYNNII